MVLCISYVLAYVLWPNVAERTVLALWFYPFPHTIPHVDQMLANQMIGHSADTPRWLDPCSVYASIVVAAAFLVWPILVVRFELVWPDVVLSICLMHHTHSKPTLENRREKTQKWIDEMWFACKNEETNVCIPILIRILHRLAMPVWKFLVSQWVHSWMVSTFLGWYPRAAVEMNRTVYAVECAFSHKFQHVFRGRTVQRFAHKSGTAPAQHSLGLDQWHRLNHI